MLLNPLSLDESGAITYLGPQQKRSHSDDCSPSNDHHETTYSISPHSHIRLRRRIIKTSTPFNTALPSAEFEAIYSYQPDAYDASGSGYQRPLNGGLPSLAAQEASTFAPRDQYYYNPAANAPAPSAPFAAPATSFSPPAQYYHNPTAPAPAPSAPFAAPATSFSPPAQYYHNPTAPAPAPSAPFAAQYYHNPTVPAPAPSAPFAAPAPYFAPPTECYYNPTAPAPALAPSFAPPLLLKQLQQSAHWGYQATVVDATSKYRAPANRSFACPASGAHRRLCGAGGLGSLLPPPTLGVFYPRAPTILSVATSAAETFLETHQANHAPNFGRVHHVAAFQP